MGTKRGLERRLARADRFDHPRVDLEQYATPPDIAAHIIHFADLRGDLQDRTVVDLGTGPGILAIGCAHRAPRRVIGVEIDAAALGTARSNERRIAPPEPVHWVRGDATRAPLRRMADTTVLMNPPFGAQRGNVHADRAFLETAARIADVSYSLHNAGSRSFVDAFADEHGGVIADGMSVTFDLAYQFSFHEETETTVDAELYRIEWADD